MLCTTVSQDPLPTDVAIGVRHCSTYNRSLEACNLIATLIRPLQSELLRISLTESNSIAQHHVIGPEYRKIHPLLVTYIDTLRGVISALDQSP